LVRLPSDWQAYLTHPDIKRMEGMSGASVFRVRSANSISHYLKVACDDRAHVLAEEIARTEWLSAHDIAVPRFVKQFQSETFTAALMTAVPGRHLTQDEENLLKMVHSLGRGLALLHSIPSETCPFDEMPITRLQRAKKAVDSGLVDITQFDERNVRLTPRRIYDRLIRNIPTRNQTVVAHGDATLSNILVCPSGEVGFIDCGNSGRSDPYLDLAILKEDLLTCFGTDAAQRFLEAYGLREWDEQRDNFFRDLYELF
jgi:aminoglycoside 3'-phosphotransferase-2